MKPKWSPMRVGSSASVLSETLPGDRGRAVLIVDGDLSVTGECTAVHFSWLRASLCLRDYVHNVTIRQDQLGLSPQEVWNRAKKRFACTGELFVPVERAEFWKDKLKQITEEYRQTKVTVHPQIASHPYFSKVINNIRPAVEDLLSQLPNASATWVLDHDESGRPLLVLTLSNDSSSVDERFFAEDLETTKDQTDRLRKLKAKFVRTGQQR